MSSLRNCFLALVASVGFMATALHADLAVVTNSAASDVSIIDTSTNTVVATLPVALVPIGVAISPNNLLAYVASFTDSVAVIDLTTLSVVTTISLTGTAPVAVAFTPDGRFAYVVGGAASEVIVIDTTTNAVVGSIHVGNEPNAISIGVTPNGTFAYVANDAGDSVSIINTATNLVVQTLAMPALSSPTDIKLTPNGLFAYVADASHPQVFVIDTTPFPNTLLTTIPVGIAEANHLAMAPDGLHAYVSELNHNNVYIIDTTINAVVPPTISGFTDPDGLAVNPEGTFLYVTNFSVNDVSIVNLATNTIGSAIPVGVHPNNIAIGGPPFSPVTNLTAKQKKDDFGFLCELFNTIKWGPISTAFSEPVAGYKIYRNGVLIATVGPNTFHYKDHNVKKGAVNTYCVFAFIASGAQSQSACVTIN